MENLFLGMKVEIYFLKEIFKMVILMEFKLNGMKMDKRNKKELIKMIYVTLKNIGLRMV